MRIQVSVVTNEMTDDATWICRDQLVGNQRTLMTDSRRVLGRPGGISGEPVPDPIPNSAVKLPSADGTKSQDLEE